MSSENEYHRTTAISNIDTVKDLIGVFLLLIFALLTIGMILAPDLFALLDQALLAKGFLDWAPVFGCALLIGLLIVFPIVLLILAIVLYRKARLRSS